MREYLSNGFIRAPKLSKENKMCYLQERTCGLLGEHFNLSLVLSEEAYEFLSDKDKQLIEKFMDLGSDILDEIVDIEEIEQNEQ